MENLTHSTFSPKEILNRAGWIVAAALLVFTPDSDRPVYSTEVRATARLIAAQGENMANQFLGEYIDPAFIDPEKVEVISKQTEINGPNRLERFSLEGKMIDRDTRKQLFGLYSTFDINGNLLSYTASSDGSNFKHPVVSAIDKVTATEGPYSSKLPDLHKQFLEKALKLPEGIDCYRTERDIWVGDKNTPAHFAECRAQVQEKWNILVETTGRNLYFTVHDARVGTCGVSFSSE